MKSSALPFRVGTAIAIGGCLAQAQAQAQAQDPLVILRFTNDADNGLVQLGEQTNWRFEVEFQGFPETSVAAGLNISVGVTQPGVVEMQPFQFVDFNGFEYGGSPVEGGGFDWLNITNNPMIHEFYPDLPFYRDNPLTIGTFTTTATGVGQVEYVLDIGLAVSPPVTFGFEDPSSGTGFNYASIVLGDVVLETDIQAVVAFDTLVVVPAPASALLLAPAGLLATRRRR